MIKRAVTVAAGTAVFVAALGLSASADIVTGTVDKVEDAAAGVVVDVSALDKVVGGAPGGGGAGPVRGTSPVVGYIAVTSQESLGLAPAFSVMGALADPNEWACSGSGTAATYSVTCLPVGSVLPVSYKCDVLHADVSTTSAGSTARTTLDCDNDGTGEAQAGTVSGAGGHASAWAVDGRAVSAFTCTIDNGRGDWTGGCGDPGTVEVAVG